MAILLALGSAVTYGAADFLGGLASKRTPVAQVTFLSQLVGSLLFGAIVVIFESAHATGLAFAWGGAAGIAGATGVTFLYRGLSLGRMSVVAPITGVVAAAIPVMAGISFGERPAPIALAGVVLALVAIALVSSAPDPSHPDRIRTGLRTPGVVDALVAGSCFAAFFILLERAGGSAGMWPLVGARIASFILLGVIVMATRTSLRPAAGTGAVIVGAGIADVLANAFYLYSTRHGLLSLVAVLTSLYPASTVLLARLVLGERMSLSQLGGLGVAAAGVVLIAAG
jgi:drug/metabolite transporter (DMT)-like permease